MMATTLPTRPSFNYRQLITLSLLLASSFVLAQNGTELLLAPPSYDDLDPVEIHGDDWRDSQDDYNYDWRSEEEQRNSRIRYGYDPSYEEVQHRNRDRYNPDHGSGTELGDTQAPAQIRFKW